MLLEVIISFVAIFLGFKFVKVDGGIKSLAKIPLINNEHCRRLSQFGSIEDLIADETTGLVYFSAGTHAGRVKYFPGLSNLDVSNTTHSIYHDQVYLFDPVAETAIPLKIQSHEPSDFVSHGISLVTGELFNHVLFVNHKRSGSVVSVFKHTKGTDVLEHLHDFKHSAISSPNSVAAVSPTEVYISNDHFFKNKILKGIEFILGPVGSTNIVHCKFDSASGKSTCNTAVNKLSYANGLEYIANTREVISAETNRGRVTRYPVLPDGKLDVANSKSLYLNTGLDNVRRVPGTNDVVVATFPNIERTVSAIRDPANYKEAVPALTLYLRETDSHSLQQQQVLYSDEGEVLPFITGFLYMIKAGKLLGGSVVYEGLLVCDIDHKSLLAA